MGHRNQDRRVVCLIVAFTIPGVPVAKARSRSVLRHGRIAHYTPEKTVNYETLVKITAAQAMKGRDPFDGPVNMRVVLCVPIPASWSKKKQADAEAGKLRPTSKPDVSNVLKAIEDGMNGVVWQDDKQIVDLWVSKFYSAAPHAKVSVLPAKVMA